MKKIVMIPIRRSRRPEALPQGVSSPDLPEGRKVSGFFPKPIKRSRRLNRQSHE
jgi:hypothetical protein